MAGAPVVPEKLRMYTHLLSDYLERSIGQNNVNPLPIIKFVDESEDAEPNPDHPETQGYLLILKYCFSMDDLSPLTPYKKTKKQMPQGEFDKHHRRWDTAVCRTVETIRPIIDESREGNFFAVNAICLPKAPGVEEVCPILNLIQVRTQLCPVSAAGHL